MVLLHIVILHQFVTLIAFYLTYSKFPERFPTLWLDIATTPPAFIKKLQKFHLSACAISKPLLIKKFLIFHPPPPFPCPTNPFILTPT